MFRQINLGLAPCLVAATLFAWGCDRPATPAGPKPSFSDGTRSCAAGARFTGGGRIDPSVAGKTTFGFHVDARDWCSSTGPINGQVQTVNHPTKTLIHSLTIDDFVSIEDPDFGRCAFFRGTARVKEGNGSWVQEPFGAVACERTSRARVRAWAPTVMGSRSRMRTARPGSRNSRAATSRHIRNVKGRAEE